MVSFFTVALVTHTQAYALAHTHTHTRNHAHIHTHKSFLIHPKSRPSLAQSTMALKGIMSRTRLCHSPCFWSEKWISLIPEKNRTTFSETKCQGPERKLEKFRPRTNRTNPEQNGSGKIASDRSTPERRKASPETQRAWRTRLQHGVLEGAAVRAGRVIEPGPGVSGQAAPGSQIFWHLGHREVRGYGGWQWGDAPFGPNKLPFSQTLAFYSVPSLNSGLVASLA